MRRNIFTSYIICNRLNLEAFFEPIIDFIEIGKPRGFPPLRTVYENFISYSSNKNNSRNGYGIESLKLLNLFIQFYLKTQKSKNPKALFCSCNYNAKKSSRRIRLYVDRYRPLESSIYLLHFFFFALIFYLYGMWLYSYFLYF